MSQTLHLRSFQKWHSRKGHHRKCPTISTDAILTIAAYCIPEWHSNILGLLPDSLLRMKDVNALPELTREDVHVRRQGHARVCHLGCAI